MAKVMIDQSVIDERLVDLVRDGFALERELMIVWAMKRISAQMPELSFTPAQGEEVSSWVMIDSLSRLRSVVGGRFKNLKERWIGAGLPLREEGKESPDTSVSEAGWRELSGWILKQGFESRRLNGNSCGFFEVRKLR